MSNFKQRLLSWMHGHVFAGDLILTLVIGVLLFGVTGSITYNPGLLFDLNPSIQMAWEAAMLIPLLIRRWRPQTGALLCVALALTHLIFGPCILGADILALVMLYSVIVYGAIHAGADADFRSMYHFHRHCSVLAACPSGNRSHDAGTQ